MDPQRGREVYGMARPFVELSAKLSHR
jgi:hypothetical protein